jgi:uncharacterized cofD-like protein
MYRFGQGDLKGHNFGNIFLSSLEKTTGSMEKAITEVGKILRIHGRVVPVTFKKTDLCVELVDGKKIIGETHIDEVEQKVNRARIKKAFLKPEISANPNAIKEIENADFILIGPGDLYTSIIPNLLAKGVASALKKSKAKKIYVMNLMTKYGQTTHYTAKDHLDDLELYVGEGAIDTVLINTKRPSKETLSWYEDFDEQQVLDDISGSRYSVIREDLLKNTVLKKSPTDSLKRSIIRHDSKKLANAIMEIIN